MFDVVARHQFRQFFDYTLNAIGVEPPLVKNHVRAVVALVGASHTAGIGKLAHA